MQELLNTCLGDTSSSEPRLCVPDWEFSAECAAQFAGSPQLANPTQDSWGDSAAGPAALQLGRLGIFEPACLGPSGSGHLAAAI